MKSDKIGMVYFGKILLLFTLYFVTAKIGLSLDAVSGFAALVWPPTGISLAALLILGLKFWPGISAGAFLINYLTGAEPLVAMGITVGNTLEAVLGVYLLRRLKFKNSLERLHDVLMLTLALTLVTMISATFGTLSLLLGGLISTSLQHTWVVWWVGNILGGLVVAPLLLVWFSNFKLRVKIHKAIEAIFLCLVLVLVSTFVIRGFGGVDTKDLPINYAVFPVLVYMALRFGQLGVVTANMILAVVTIYYTALGFGPFTKIKLSESLLYLQSFIGVTSVTFLVLAGIIDERKELSRRKDDFIKIASHELKTPVASLKGFTQILLKTFKGQEKYRYYLSRMNDQVDKLTVLINDLLDVSKIQSGAIVLQKTKFDVNELIQEVIKDIKLSTKTHQIVFDKGVKRKALADKDRLSQVLTNLILNAIKFSPKAHKIIVKSKASKDYLEVQVIDFGIGVSERDRHRIFEPFYQVDNKIRQSFSGLGLGLHISSEIIKRHSGTIKVESTKGKGSVFSFRIPVS